MLVRSHGGSLYDSTGRPVPADYWEIQFSALRSAREESALFLHHDAITGTSRSAVVNDYLERMSRAQQRLQLMMANMLQHLITREPQPSPLLTASLYTIDIADAQQLPPGQSSQPADAPLQPLFAPVILFNSLAWARQELVSLKVGTRYVLVQDAQGAAVQAQVDLDWESAQATEPLQSAFTLSFTASLPPLSAVTYFLHLSPVPHAAAAAAFTEQSVTVLYSAGNRLGSMQTAVQSRYLQYRDSTAAPISVENRLLRLHLSSSSGLLTAVDDLQHQLNLTLQQQFELYRTTQSGAYLFRPNPDTPQVSSRIARTAEAAEHPMLALAAGQRSAAAHGRWALLPSAVSACSARVHRRSPARLCDPRGARQRAEPR